MSTNYNLRKQPKASLKKREANDYVESEDNAHSSNYVAAAAGIIAPQPSDTPTDSDNPSLPLRTQDDADQNYDTDTTDEDDENGENNVQEKLTPPSPAVDTTLIEHHLNINPATSPIQTSTSNDQLTQLILNLQREIKQGHQSLENKMTKNQESLENKIIKNRESLENKITKNQESLENKIIKSQESLKNEMKQEMSMNKNEIKQDILEMKNNQELLEKKITKNQDSLEALENKIFENHDKLQTTLTQQMNTLETNVDNKIKEHQSTFENKLTETINKVNSRADEIEEKQDELKTEMNKQIANSQKEIKLHVTNSLLIHKEEVNCQLKNFISEQEENIKSIECSLEEKTTSLISVTQSELENTISQVNQLKTQIGKAENNMTNIHVTCTGNNSEIPLQNMPKFNGRQSNPRVFLERLQAYYTRYASRRNVKIDTDIDLLSEILENCLENHSARWWQLIKYEINTWSEFKEIFLAKYWSRDIQRGIRQRLEIEKYRSNGPLSRAEYFIDRVITLQSMDPSPTEDEVISILVEHYDDVIKNARRVQNINNIRDFESLLQREDMLERNNSLRRPNESRPNNNRPPTQPHDQRRPTNFQSNFHREPQRNNQPRPRSPPYNNNHHFYQRNNDPSVPAFNRNQPPHNQHRQPPPPHYQSRTSQPPPHHARSASYPTAEQCEVFHTIASQHPPQDDNHNPNDIPSLSNNNHSNDRNTQNKNLN